MASKVLDQNGQPQLPATGSSSGGGTFVPAEDFGIPIVGTVGPGGAANLGQLAYTGTPGEHVLITCWVSVLLAATIPDTSYLATFELFKDGASLSPARIHVASVAAQQIPAGGTAGGFVQIAFSASDVVADGAEHIYSLKCSAELPTTTMLVGSDAPLASDGEMNLWHNQ